MNKVISWLQSIRLRQIITVFLVSLTFFVANAFGIYGAQLQAQAEPITPEATSYGVEKDKDYYNQGSVKAERIKEDAEKSARLVEEEGIEVKNKAQDSGKNLFENIRNKLNLDEPIDPGTKQAAEQLKETVTGDRD